MLANVWAQIFPTFASCLACTFCFRILLKVCPFLKSRATGIGVLPYPFDLLSAMLFLWVFEHLFVLFDSLRPSPQFFSQVRTGPLGLNQY